MRDSWMLIVVLGVAVAAGMWNSDPAPAAKADMPAAMGEMGGMAAMGEAATTTAPAAPEGDACCPTDGDAAAKHDCSKHEGEPCTEHGAAAEAGGEHAAHGTSPAGELTPDQMSGGACPMGSPAAEAPGTAAAAKPATEEHAAHEGHEAH